MADSTEFPEVFVIGGAESGALAAAPRPAAELAAGSRRPADRLLGIVAERWPELTAEQRLAILEIATAGPGPRPSPVDDTDGSPRRSRKANFRRRVGRR